ncbi:MAG: hypothetical protein GEV07_29655 [Streptosporangiales bacterium]|nr:hypothetical protein [Streptosporangiales bacterium]
MSTDEHGEPQPPSDPTPDATPVEVRPVDARLGIFPYGYAVRAPGRRLRVILLAYVPVYLVSLLAIVPLQLVGDTAVVNGSVELFGFSTTWLVVGGVLLVVGVLAMFVGHGAATLVGIAESVRISSGEAGEADGETAEEAQAPVLSLRAATVAAAKRLPTLFVLWLLGVLLVAVLLAAVLASTFTELPIGVAITFVGLVCWLVFSPFAVAWPVALAERRGPFGALRRSVQLTRGRMFRLGLLVLFFGYGIPWGLSYGVSRIPDIFGQWLPPWRAALLVAVLGWAVAVLALAVLASVQVSVLFYDKVVADLQAAPGDTHTYLPLHREEHAIDRDRLLGVLDAPPREWRWVAGRRRDVALWVVAGLLVPGPLAVGLLWLNPVGVPAYAAAELSDSTSDLRHRLVPMPDGSVTVVTRLSDSVYFDRCVGAQCVELPDDEDEDGDDSDDSLSLIGSGVASASHGNQVVLSGWRSDDGYTRDEEDSLPKLRLLTCRPAECTTDAAERAPVLDRHEPQYEGDGLDGLEVRTTVAADGDGGFVGGVVRRGRRPDRVPLRRRALRRPEEDGARPARPEHHPAQVRAARAGRARGSGRGGADQHEQRRGHAVQLRRRRMRQPAAHGAGRTEPYPFGAGVAVQGRGGRRVSAVPDGRWSRTATSSTAPCGCCRAAT